MGKEGCYGVALSRAGRPFQASFFFVLEEVHRYCFISDIDYLFLVSILFFYLRNICQYLCRQGTV